MSINFFISGAITIGYIIAALFFLRFWKTVHDRLFLFFSMAFVALAVERILFVCISPREEIVPYIYIFRLLAFILILIAIIDKNRK